MQTRFEQQSERFEAWYGAIRVVQLRAGAQEIRLGLDHISLH